MRGEFDIRVEGLADLRRGLRKLDREALSEVQQALKGTAQIAARKAAQFAPQRTGRLAASYRPFTRGNVAGVRSPLPYAAVHEFGGTIRPRGAPIVIRRSVPVHRAIESEMGAMVERLGDGIENAARGAGWH